MWKMPVDSNEKGYSELQTNFCNEPEGKSAKKDSENTNCQTDSLGSFNEKYIIPETDTHTPCNLINGNKQELFDTMPSVRPKVFSARSPMQQKQWKQFEPNKWRKMVGFHVSGNELKSSLFSKKQKSKRLRFAQAKRNLSQLYSYFAVRVAECDPGSSLVIGLSRKDFPSTTELGTGLGSVGYDAGTGTILLPHEQTSSAPQFSNGDIIGCGVVFPSHYRRYADLSTDDSSDGMTDIVLTSLLNVNKKSMDFVQCVLGLKRSSSDSSSSEEEIFFSDSVKKSEEADYYNENYTESRTKVQVYFTHNMQVVGKVAMCIPVGGFYPTIQVDSPGTVRLQFEFS